MNPATKAGAGRVVELLRGADLFDTAGVHDDDTVCESHCLHLIVGHIYGRGPHLLMDALDLGAHLHAQLGIEIGQGFVEQKDLGVAHDRAPHCDALPLTAGKLLRPPVQQIHDVQYAGGVLDPLTDLGTRRTAQAQAEGHVLEHGHVRIQRVVLEHHRDVAVLRRHVVHQRAVDVDLPIGRFLEAGDHAQGSALAAAGRADEHDELLVGDVQVDASNRLHLVEPLHDVAQRDVSHLPPPFGSVLLSRTDVLVSLGARLSLGRARGETGDVIVHQKGVDHQRRRGS